MTNIKVIVLIISLNNIYTLQLYDECDQDGINGVCLRLTDCPPAQKMIPQGDLPQTCSFDTDFHPIVCCPSLSVLKCQEYSEILQDSIPIDQDDTWRIVGGTNASKGEYPHMAALGFGEFPDISWLCGGTLISDQFILTAAHCLEAGDKKVSYVFLGDNYLSNNLQESDERVYKVLNRYRHPNYKRPPKYNDIALLKLSREVKFSSFVKPACLHTEDQVDQSSLEATGWGLVENEGIQSDILQKVQLDLFDQSDCEGVYNKYTVRLLPSGIVHSQLCAGSKTKKNVDTCQGDSGGPLQYIDFKKGLHYVVGVTSFGRSCGGASPGVYTKVSSFISWIEDMVWK